MTFNKQQIYTVQSQTTLININSSSSNISISISSNKWSEQFGKTRPHRWRRQMVQADSSGGTNVPSHVGTLAPPGEYD